MRRLLLGSAWTTLAIGGGLFLVGSPSATIAAAVGIATASLPIGALWRASRGTALRPAVAWATAGLVLGMAAELIAIAEPPQGGRPWSGHLTYLACLTAVASLITVLNARRPGGGAWAFLMGMLVLVFLIPWLEGAGPSGRGGALVRLRLEMPWSLFFGLLVATGTTNFLPTRHGLAALVAAAALGIELAALMSPDWPESRLALVWSVVPWLLSVAVWVAEASSRRPRVSSSGLERLWSWFRDHWGVVWALRIEERFNRSAEAAGWPIRIAWHGVVRAETGQAASPLDIPEGAEETLRGLIRRFADPERLDQASGHA